MFRSCLNIETISFTVIFHWLVFQRDLSILYFDKKTPWEKNLGILAAVSCPWVALKPQRVVTFLLGTSVLTATQIILLSCVTRGPAQ